MKLTELWNNFDRFVKLNYKSKDTYSSYKNCFWKYVSDNSRVYRMSSKDIEDYLIEFSRRFSVSYYNQMVSMLKILYADVLKQPRKTKSLKMLKQPNTLQDVLSVSQVRNRISKLSNKKHQLILSTIYLCGLRVGELVNLDVRDIDHENLRLKIVKGKGEKDRYVPMSPRLSKFILKHGAKEGKLIQGRNGKYSDSSVRKICKKVGINNPHLLRHSIITHLIDSGDQQQKVQDFAGHKSPQSTQKYYHLSLNSLDSLSIPQ